MTEQETRDAIAFYDKEVEILKSVITKKVLLSHNDFGEEFRDFHTVFDSEGEEEQNTIVSPLMISADDGAAILLGNFFGHHAKWITLTQHLVEVGDVDTEIIDNVVHYKIAE